MRIWVLGIGDAFSEHSYNASFIVQGTFNKGFFHLAVECPHPYRKILLDCEMRRGLRAAFYYPKLDDINHFLVSHLHGDHMNGLEDVIFYKRYIQGIKPNIYMAQDDLDKLWENRLKCAMGQSYDGAKFSNVSEDFYYNKYALPSQIGPFDIEVRRTKHHIPASAVIIREQNKSIGFSADTAFDMDLINWLDQADLIIHEANEGPGHSSYIKLSTLPKRIRDKMMLIHCPDYLRQDGKIRHLREGEIFEV